MVAISKRSLLLVCEENRKQTDRRFSETITKSLRVQLLKKGKGKHKGLKLPSFKRFEADPSSVNPSSEQMHYKGSPTKEVVPSCVIATRNYIT